MQIYLAATPESSQEAQKFCRNLAHVAYRIGEDSVLLRQSLLLQTRGGLLCVSDRDAPFIDRPEALRDAVLRECGRRTYSGVLLDFEEAPRQDRLAFAAALGSALAASAHSSSRTQAKDRGRYSRTSASVLRQPSTTSSKVVVTPLVSGRVCASRL